MTGHVDLCEGETILFVSRTGDEQKDGRFLDVLKTTWRRIPSEARRQILAHYDPRHLGCARVDFSAPLPGPVGFAQANKDGAILWCNSMCILDLEGGNESTTSVIGEELAHAFLIVSGDPTHDGSLKPAEPEAKGVWEETMEAAAREQMRKWGFDMEAHARLIKWCEANTSRLLRVNQPISEG